MCGRNIGSLRRCEGIGRRLRGIGAGGDETFVMGIAASDDLTGNDEDPQLQSIAHGVIMLEHSTHVFGGERRRLAVKKLRGAQYRGGYHDFRICPGGLEVYPRLPHAGHRAVRPQLVAHS